MIQFSAEIPVSTAVASRNSLHGEGCNAVIGVVFQHTKNLAKDEHFRSELNQFKRSVFHQIDHHHLGFGNSSSDAIGLWQILNVTKLCLNASLDLSTYALSIQVSSGSNESVIEFVGG